MRLKRNTNNQGSDKFNTKLNVLEVLSLQQDKKDLDYTTWMFLDGFDVLNLHRLPAEVSMNFLNHPFTVEESRNETKYSLIQDM